MARAVLPDSSFYIRCLRTGLDPFQELAGFAEEYEFATCGMVVIEVSRGLRERRVLERFRERFSIMPFIATGVATWERATDLAWTLDRKGRVIPATDVLIAACALQANAAVLTSDAHFQEIPGLTALEYLD
jgi:predicted nucleic acid-binding protein